MIHILPVKLWKTNPRSARDPGTKGHIKGIAAVARSDTVGRRPLAFEGGSDDVDTIPTCGHYLRPLAP